MGVAPRRVLIDTDPGVDDAMAIFLALASPELDVIGLTTIFGNAATTTTTRNALALLQVADRADIPVAAGANNPLAMEYLGAVPHIHGTNGLGDAAFEHPAAAPHPTNASEFIYEQAVLHRGELTIVALGPLTNLATALADHPDLADLVEQVVIMGGNALVPGNATPTAEANINNDPEAADLVFGAGWPLTMIGLDVTQQTIADAASLQRITSGSTPASRLLGDAIPLYRRFSERNERLSGIFLHDPSTIAYLLDPGAYGIERWSIRVETEGFSRGKTWPNPGRSDEETPLPWVGRPLVNVCTTVDAARVVALIEERLSRQT